MSAKLPALAVLGGTGAEGAGLARRWARAGYLVIVGSRSAERARVCAAALGVGGVRGADNATAAAECDIAVLTVPFAAQRATLETVKEPLQGKILVDVTVPLVPPKVARVQLPPEGSAARIARSVLGEGVRVVAAFQNVSASHLADPDHEVQCDVMVFGDDPDARSEVVRLAEAAGMRGVHAGPLDNAAAAEALTSVLIFINKRYKVPGAGIRVTTLPPDGPG